MNLTKKERGSIKKRKLHNVLAGSCRNQSVIQPHQHGSMYTAGKRKGLTRDSTGRVHMEPWCVAIYLD